jgi:aminopeptidase N
MENWGCVIYGETSMLWNEDWYGAHYRSTTAYIIAHELAHYWFGNLVTCEWWSDAWLNEGFASYFEARALESIGWEGDEMVYYQRTKNMFNSDIRSTSSPVRPTIVTPWQSWNAFSTSSYSKGASMLRMFGEILGEEVLQSALQEYLEEHDFSTADTDDLWEELTEEAEEEGITNPDGSPLDFKEKFDPWVLQPGFPLIRAIRNYETEELTVSQRHFNPNDEEWPESEFGYLWNVPISILTDDDNGTEAELVAWMDRVPAIVIEDEMPSDDDEWYVINPGADFFYRVQYDEQNYDNIFAQLEEDHEEFDVETRAALIDDLFALAREDVLTEVDAFDISLYLDEEDEGLPWLVFDSYLPYVDEILERFPETYELFEDYIESQVDQLFIELGWDFDWDEDDIHDSRLQEMAMRLACTYRNPRCLLENWSRFEQWKDLPADDNPVVAGLRPTFYCIAVREGDAEDWDAIYERYKEDSGNSHLHFDSIEKRNLLEALACSEDEVILHQYFDDLFEPGYVEFADRSAAVLSLADSDHGRDVVWDHLVENWRANNTVPVGVTKASVLNAVVSGFASEADQLEFTNFVARYPPEDEAEEGVYDRASDILSDNRFWAERNVNALHNWFLQHGPIKKK